MIKGPQENIVPKFSCPECSIKLKTKQSRFIHRLLLHYNNSNHCSLCNIDFKNNSGALAHKRKVHRNELHALSKRIVEEEKVNACQSCENKYYSKNSLRHHWRNFHLRNKDFPLAKPKGWRDNMDFLCFFCPESVKYKNMSDHCLEVHGKQDEEVGDGKLKCMVCDKIFPNKKLMTRHRMTHNKTRIFECKLCYHTSKIESNHSSHLRHVHKSKDDQYLLKHGKEENKAIKCSHCNLSFFTEAHKVRHSNIVHNSQSHNKKISRNEPRERIKPAVKKESIKKNIVTTASDDKVLPKSYKCKLCYREIKRKQDLMKHYETHKSSEEQHWIKHGKTEDLKFACTFCDLKFFTQILFNDHLIKAHQNSIPISCEFCGKSGTWKERWSLYTHIKRVHKVKDYNLSDLASRITSKNTVNDFQDFVKTLI